MLDQPAELNAATELFQQRDAKGDRAPNAGQRVVQCRRRLCNRCGERQLAAELYKTWIAYNGDNEVLYAVYFNYGVALNDAATTPAPSTPSGKASG